jgi:hypothetical protein
LYRFDEEDVIWMGEHFIDDATGETRGGALTTKQQMEVFLRHVGDPGFQEGVGLDIGVHQSTVSKTFVKVLNRIVEKALWINFPMNQGDIQTAKDAWQDKFKILCAIGALDCTHIRILKPGRHGDEYINRRGAASINVQATCDGGERFTSGDAEWPGSVHDSRIWKNSVVGKFMMNSRTDALLLGDEGYGIAPWLMTPFKDPKQPTEQCFNCLFTKERVIIERCFGQLKRRFPILQERVRLNLQNVPSVIVACFVLRNVAKYVQDPDDFLENQANNDDDGVDDGEEYNDARIRQRGQERRRMLAEIIHEMDD